MQKIIESNCNKALKAIEKLQKAIVNTIDRQIDPTIREIKNHHQEVCDNLDRSTEKFILNLTNSAFYEIDQFKSDFRKEMHERIERGIGDGECKKIFENELKQRETKLIENIERRFKECEERFRGSVGKNIEQFEERVKDSLAMSECIGINNGNFDSNSTFNFASGIDGIGLFSSIAGLVALLMMPVVGEFVLIAGVALAFVGIGKSIWGFFDSDYKRSQQKKEVDKNLHQICEKIVQDVKSRLESRKKDIWEKIEKLKANLRPVDNYKRMKRQLKEAHERLGYISHSIHLTISKQGACNE